MPWFPKEQKITKFTGSSKGLPLYSFSKIQPPDWQIIFGNQLGTATLTSSRWGGWEDEKMWRCEDNKMKKCEYEKMLTMYNPFPLLPNVPHILKIRVHLWFWKICGWPIWCYGPPNICGSSGFLQNSMRATCVKRERRMRRESCNWWNRFPHLASIPAIEFKPIRCLNFASPCCIASAVMGMLAIERSKAIHVGFNWPEGGKVLRKFDNNTIFVLLHSSETIL